MNFNEYQDLATRTANKNLTSKEQLCNWAMGLCGEAGEYTEHIKKHLFHNKQLDVQACVKELGDILWYVAQCALVLNQSMDEIATQNIEKLKARYPEGFKDGGGIR
jgi:NTP pyrophosphatase (non-canonical NTP hydrolase)